MYIAVVRPILFYGITVWWPSVDKSTIRNKLTAVQRVACMMITGALPSTPTKALETLLHLLPADLYGKLQASCNAIRLNALIKSSDTRFGHSRILEDHPEDFRRQDYTVPPTGLKNHFQTRFPSREEWEEHSVLISYSDSTAIYTDGSKLHLKIYAAFFRLNSNKLKIARQIWPKLDKRRSRPLPHLKRPLLRHVIGVLTGHCLMGI
ncbi:uncharacterized protein LOC118735080 [Rhagoletis pomonella]|uniref:uncharacterized protein LOC118735080 n=1 Tax=Rhagoletis pomonella TaxID=28610 RepID=UPI00177E6245|nr:uncharacterized protein LOC118735080 [Rhagoletis pomonella]